MLEHAWVRFVAASLLLSAYEAVDTLARFASRRNRPPEPRTPRWARFVSFAALTFFYVILGREGGSMLGGIANRAGFLLAFLAMGLRFATRNGTGPVRHPQQSARVLFFAALPLALGAPHAWLILTLPAVITAAAWVRSADALASGSSRPLTR